MFLSVAGDVAAEGHAILRRAKAEAVAVAGEIRAGIAREKPGLVAIGAEGEAGAARIEVRLSEHEEATGVDHRAIGNAEFFRRAEVIADEPAADVHGVRGWVEQLDAVSGRRHIGAREDLVDEDGREGGRRGFVAGGGAVQLSAGTPV